MSPIPAANPAPLVQRLNNLHDGLLVLPEVIRLGDAAIGPLEALLRGPSQALHHARSLAADALAAIGTPAATAALVRALRDSIERDPEPVLLEAESILVNHIAAHLAQRRENAFTEVLIEALSRRAYPACARALGELHEPRAIPLLIECLHDDAARAAAVAALRGLGPAASEALARTLAVRELRGGLEPPSYLDGRVAAARLLGEINDTRLAPPWVKRILCQALDDPEPCVRLEAALALARDRRGVVRKAAAVLAAEMGHVSWARAREVRDALARMASVARH